MADLTVTAASVLWTSGTKTPGVAGAAVTAGQCVYLDSVTSTLKLAQSDGTAAEVAAVGIALHAAGTGQPLQYAAQGSLINIGATTSKATSYATATDGSFVVDIKDHGVAV
jgi:hypothetical protein